MKSSAVSSLLTANAAIVVGLINTPGSAWATTTAANHKLETWNIRKTIPGGAKSTKHTPSELAALDASYVSANPWLNLGANSFPPPSGIVVSGPHFSGTEPTLYFTEYYRSPEPPVATSVQGVDGNWYLTYDYTINIEKMAGTPPP